MKIVNITRYQVVSFLIEAGWDGMSMDKIQKELVISTSAPTHHFNYLKIIGLF